VERGSAAKRAPRVQSDDSKRKGAGNAVPGGAVNRKMREVRKGEKSRKKGRWFGRELYKRGEGDRRARKRGVGRGAQRRAEKREGPVRMKT